MGLSSKRSRKAHQIDIEVEDDDVTDIGKPTFVDSDEEDYEEENDFEDEEGNGNEDEEDDAENGFEDEDSEEEEIDGEQTDGLNDEMEELQKEYMDLRNQEQGILKNLKHHKDEDVLKGQAVKNQKTLWDKTLEFRFLFQKAFSSSNKLPQEPVRSAFCNLDEGISVAYSDLVTSSKETLDSLLELHEALVENNPTIAQSTDGHPSKPSENCRGFDVEGDEEWSQISGMHARLASFRDKSIDKWQRKAQVTTGAAAIKGKFQAFNQDISQQVANYMRDPSRMIKQMQLSRSAIGVLGYVPKEAGNVAEEPQGDGDPELLDDSEFYQQLLKEFFETVDVTSSETAYYALKRLQTKKRKIVDRRASKSRKIRYNVHEKIVNFMAPHPMELPPMAPKLFENLFGLKT